ncbi:methionine-tRNA ligase (EC:6.1.) [Fonticula alba]|uniref:methionine--tRNA ligase n=1 Tax=Fonticula alba TaxID=691883 RepID=A0A058Z1H4_FONAL|nr:methionine-tRNA ligase (EC:6.1.) [Fonticula alba]KCV67372.1 methionine-tRNA ligase (EC:6.1.) [Fonticula alba]|eukprot:XP_009498228.1 methionine-tRNA ligase (EC:6.1.) [Fonticula alba]
MSPVVFIQAQSNISEAVLVAAAISLANDAGLNVQLEITPKADEALAGYHGDVHMKVKSGASVLFSTIAIVGHILQSAGLIGLDEFLAGFRLFTLLDTLSAGSSDASVSALVAKHFASQQKLSLLENLVVFARLAGNHARDVSTPLTGFLEKLVSAPLLAGMTEALGNPEVLLLDAHATITNAGVSLIVIDCTEPLAALRMVDESLFHQSPSAGTILPKEGERNILITSALPYVNNSPHLGNIIGCVLSADVYARYCRQRGYNTLYVCGTDEYGTATETLASERGESCRSICDRYNALHTAIYKWFDIDFDHFGRTTDPKHAGIAQGIFSRIYERGLFSKQTIDQWWCEKDQRFLSDRFVEGTCNFCKFPDARGDQCDGCGKLINAVELIDPRCKLCRSTPVMRQSEHMFLHLEKVQDDLQAWIKEASTGMWSDNSKSITESWLREGLRARCMTRDLSWGTPVPLPGMENKVLYVWFDAPIGYLSITAEYTDDWELWWKNPEQVQLYQFMGKDNVPFHTVMFPCSLIGTGDKYTMLNHLSTTEYLNYEGGKFSKSRNIGVFGDDAIASGIPACLWRYYLLANRPEQHDSQFNWTDFGLRVNSELLANVGNLVNRTLGFLDSRYRRQVPAPGPNFDPATHPFVQEVNTLLAEYLDRMETLRIRDALHLVMRISAAGNNFITATGLGQTLLNENPDECNTLLYVMVNFVYLIATLLHPFIPATSVAICEQLSPAAESGAVLPLLALSESFRFGIKPGHVIGTPARLFERLSEETLAALKVKHAGSPAPAATA